MPAKKKKKAETGTVSIDIKGIPKAEELAKLKCDERKEKGEGGVAGIIFGILVIALGVVWMGNEAGWWLINLPFWPLVIVIIGLFMFFGSLKKMMSR